MSDESKELDPVVSFAVAPFLAILLLPFNAYVAWADAFVLQKIWTWHAVPYGLPSITFGQALVPFLAGMLLSNRYRGTVPADTRTASAKAIELAGYFIMPWVVLAIGWWFT